MRPSLSVTSIIVACFLLVAARPAAAVDLTAAEAQFKKSCGTCHTTVADAPARQGPNLFGVIDRKAGSMPGFKYSAPFIAGGADIVWDEATLDRWLTDPQSLIPGTFMVYKQADPDKRRLVIEYLKSQR
jgi:cytochrome c